jgi:hypothetical protein
MSSPLTRTYTPPTCTLEVTAQPSALSRWSNTPVVKSLQFILNLEGLAKGDREPVALQGDQTQLAELSEAVSSYVQRLVSSRHTELPLKASTSPPSPETAERGLFDDADAPPIHLKSRTLLTHELVLGDLATSDSGNSIVLKVSQLYDLATALANCNADLQQLPVAAPVAAAAPRRVPAWAKTAAAVALTAGVGTATWQLLNLNQPAFQQASQPPASSPGKAPVVGISPPPLPEARPRRSIQLPTVALPDRTKQPEIVARINPGDRSPEDNTNLLSAKSGGTANKSSSSESPVKLDPLPAEPAPISPNIPESAISMAQNEATPSSSAADSTASTGSQQNSGTTENAKIMNESSQALSTAAVRTKQGAQGTGGFSNAPAPVTAPPVEAPPSVTKPNEDERERLSDFTPQIKEARRTIAQSQKATPSRVVEYRLTVNPNGSLAAIEPLGQAAQQYLPNLSLSVGQPFVSASGQRSKIRLVVSPDGKVQTFPERADPEGARN